MTGRTAPSLPTYGLSSGAQIARNAQYTGTPFTDVAGDGSFGTPYLGMNSAGSNAPGIGIATGIVAAASTAGLLPEKWTLLDQTATQRVPQQTEHLGGINDAEDLTLDPPFTPGVFPVKLLQGADVNDVVNFVVADTAAVDGAIADTVSGTINDTGATIAIGNVLWGKDPVA